jgi:hypothetical protein
MSRKALLQYCLGLAIGASTVQIADAGFLAGYKGNSIFGTGSVLAVDNQSSDGTVSFSVYENTDGDWTDDFGFALGDVNEGLAPFSVIQKAAKYVYFYQVVNDDPVPGVGQGAETDIDSFFVNFQSLAINVVTGGGYITDAVFNDGADISNSNPGLGPDDGSLGGDPDSPVGDGVPSALYAGTPTIDPPGLGTQEASDAVSYNGFRIEFIFDNTGSSIAPTARSAVLYLTSNFAPIWSTGTLNDGGLTKGDIPVPNPEPGSLAMTLGALACGLVAIIRKKQKAA